ncbi:MAG: hypothetical protein DMG98_03360 [Acidobacteria bacterium]|nr:MAG: hypothetical protein DMG98_03360 [Acidobacteriota bacterium]
MTAAVAQSSASQKTNDLQLSSSAFFRVNRLTMTKTSSIGFAYVRRHNTKTMKVPMRALF